MKKWLLLVVIYLVTSVIYSQKSQITNVTLSDSAKITILTCGPGSDLYSLFGHSAIRVNDKVNKIDLVFNYGTFDFSAPNFYTKFAKGELDYCLSAYAYRYFPISYIEENRWIDEQVLNIDNKSSNTLFKALLINAQESNRYYRYDFFFDNCATRIRDILVCNIPNLELPNDSLTSNLSYRDQMNHYLTPHPWTRFGLNIALGSKCDLKMSNWSFTYLPDNLSEFLSNTHIKHNTQYLAKIALISSQARVVNSQETYNSNVIFKPIYLITILLIVSFLTYFYSINSNIVRFIDSVIFFVVGFAGIIVYFLSFLSSHLICSSNYNVLLVTPLYLIYLFPSFIKFKVYLSYILLISLLAYFFAGIFGFQTYTIEAYLLAIVLVTRILSIIPLSGKINFYRLQKKPH